MYTVYGKICIQICNQIIKVYALQTNEEIQNS
jgi:hypothetical protein